ncbi:probable rRNA maturation factor [Clostridium sp. CAG:768]|nr:probable rRNA maturation factor [Clostridium sp. CAG:768]
MTKYNIFSENIYDSWQIDEKFFIDTAKKILKFYLSSTEVYEKSCLSSFDYNTVSFDFLYCDSIKTHEINREYRNKDYPADIITFAIFADSEEKFIFDGEINLGEVIIALDKVIEEADKKGVSKEFELSFLISHGILHLLGFDHQTEEDYNFIIDLQNKALESIGV